MEETLILSADEVLPKWEIKAHINSLECVAAHPKDPIVATGSHDRLIKLWDIGKGSLLTTLSGHKEGVWSVDFSKDGKTLLSGSPDSTLCLWDLKAGKASKVMTGHKSRVYNAKYNENDQLVASGGSDEMLVWDMRKGTVLARTGKASSGHVYYAMCWSKNGEFLASAETGGRISLY